MTWTLFTDESGQFEDLLREDPEARARVVGGVWLPGDPTAIGASCATVVAESARRHGIHWPLHAKDNADVGARDRFLADVLRALPACEIHALVAPPDPGHFGLHALLNGDLIESVLRARCIGLDAGELHLVFATRRLRIDPRELEDAVAAGEIVRTEWGRNSVQEHWMSTFLHNEARAVARRVAGGRIRVAPTPRMAAQDDSPVMLDIADFIVNTLRRRLSTKSQPTRAALAQDLGVDVGRLHIYGPAGVDLLRRRDTLLGLDASHLRLGEPDVTGLARLVAEHGVRPTGWRLAEQETLTTALAEGLGRAGSATDRATLLHVLQNDLRRILDVKGGNYEHAAIALNRFWPRETEPVPPEVRGDALLALRLWRNAMEVHNHRGLVREALEARHRFSAARATEGSLAAAALDIEVTNLANVMLQNEFLAPADEFDALRAALVNDAVALVALAGNIRTATLALGSPNGPDAAIGRLLGTAARSMAFLERWDEADTLVLAARREFTSERDLVFNRIVRVRIALARRDGTVAGEEMVRLLGPAIQPAGWPERLLRNPGERFALDLVLRALAFGVEVPGLDPAAWRLELADPKGILASLRVGVSHPVELVARHAWECVHLPMWENLALEAARVGGPTIERIGRFTRHLTAGRPPEGPRGSVLNPSFEYR